MALSCPTVFRGGRARYSIWRKQEDGTTLSKLPPSMALGPQHSAHPILANCHPRLRVPSSITSRVPKDYFDASTTICLNANGNLFQFVWGQAYSEGSYEDLTREDWFGCVAERQLNLFWPFPDEESQTYAIRYGYLELLNIPSAAVGDRNFCRSEKLVACPALLIFPIGPICPAAAGFSGLLRALLPVTPWGCEQLLMHPLIVEFSNKWRVVPEKMASTWIARPWIADGR
jgi:hypothetical protein